MGMIEARHLLHLTLENFLWSSGMNNLHGISWFLELDKALLCPNVEYTVKLRLFLDYSRIMFVAEQYQKLILYCYTNDKYGVFYISVSLFLSLNHKGTILDQFNRIFQKPAYHIQEKLMLKVYCRFDFFTVSRWQPSLPQSLRSSVCFSIGYLLPWNPNTLSQDNHKFVNLYHNSQAARISQ